MAHDTKETLLERAYRWEKERPDAVYLTQPIGGGEVRDYTWAEAMDESRRMARHLRSLGHPPGSRIAILSKNCAQFIMSDLAIWMAGHVSVALYPTLQAETVEYILRHCNARALFVGKLDDWDMMRPGVPDDLYCMSYPSSPPNDFPTWEDLIAQNEPIGDSPVPDPDADALVIYTSGSTGQPKGVVHTFRIIAEACDGFSQVLEFSEQDRLLSYLPLAHVFERAAIEAASLYSGCHVFFAESLDTFVADIQRARPTVFQSVPRLWLKFQLGVFQKMPQQRLSTLLRIPIVSGLIRKKLLTGLGLDQTRIAVSGSAPIPEDLIHWYRGLGLELLEGYAMSENFAYSHFSLPKRSRVGYVGNALPNVEHRISKIGEIEVRTPTNMTGYLDAPEKTAESFTEDGYLRTGDRGEIDDAGRLRITGRVKELFKTSKGKYVAPAPIENTINACQFVEASCVTGDGRPMAHAIVMLGEEPRRQISNPDTRASIESELRKLLHEVNASVEPHEKLQFISVVSEEWQIENGFLTPTMKIKRNAIEDAYAQASDAWYEARSEIIWHE